MTRIVPNLLNDTLNLVALARETALARGDQARAEKLAPVVADLRSLVSGAPKPAVAPQKPPAAAPSGVLGQDDFRTLLRAVQAGGGVPPAVAAPPSAASSQERNQVAVAMAAGGTPDVDIARQLGITREEVRLILSLNQPQRAEPGPDSGPVGELPDEHKSMQDRLAGGPPGARPAGSHVARAYTRWAGNQDEVLK
jgi:hypothetical protein